MLLLTILVSDALEIPGHTIKSKNMREPEKEIKPFFI